MNYATIDGVEDYSQEYFYSYSTITNVHIYKSLQSFATICHGGCQEVRWMNQMCMSELTLDFANIFTKMWQIK
jgi:hypothetical protein